MRKNRVAFSLDETGHTSYTESFSVCTVEFLAVFLGVYILGFDQGSNDEGE
jgi:hypothetical protein